MVCGVCFPRGHVGPLPYLALARDQPWRSRVIRLLFLVVISALVADGHAYAQEQDGQQANEAHGRNVLLAGAIELVVPVLGHAYAGDAVRGLWPAAVAAAGLGAMEVALFVIDDNCRIGEDGVEVCDNARAEVLMLGILTYLAARAWGVVSAVNTARQANALLMRERAAGKGAEVDLSVAQIGQFTIGLVVRF